jgi:hypothetical protein
MKQAGPRDWSPPEYDNSRMASGYRYSSRESTTSLALRTLVRNGPGRLALLFGLVAAVLALFPTTPLGVGLGFVSSAIGITAIAYGVFALKLHRRREATARPSPIVGILLGTFGAFVAGTLVASFYLNGAPFESPFTYQGAETAFNFDPQGVAPSTATETSQIIAPPLAPAPEFFASAEEERRSLIQNLGTVNFVLNQIAPGTKPASLSLATPGGTLSTPDGQALAILPEGTTVNYARTSDGFSYVITLKGAAFDTIVQFDSAIGYVVAPQ